MNCTAKRMQSQDPQFPRRACGMSRYLLFGKSCKLRVVSTIIVLLRPFGQSHAARTPRAASCVPLTSLPVARSPRALSAARSKLAASAIPRPFACWLLCAGWGRVQPVQ